MQSDRAHSSASAVLNVDIDYLVKRLFLICIAIEVAFVLLDITVNRWQWSETGSIRRLFNIAREDGLASWFAVTQTIFVSLIAWLIYALTTVRDVRRHQRAGWLFVALFFTYMAVDDGAEVHERIGTAISNSSVVRFFPSYAWQVLFGPIFIAVGIFLLYFLWKELRRAPDRWRLIFAISSFGVAVIMDFVEGLENGYLWFEKMLGWSVQNVEHYSKSIEEFIEMVGMSLFLIIFLAYIPQLSKSISFNFARDEGRR